MRKRMIPVCILLALMLVLQSAAVFAEPEDGDTTEELPAEEPVYEEPADDPYAAILRLQDAFRRAASQPGANLL